MSRVLALARQLVLIALLAAAGGYYWYVRTPCHLPVAYTVGAIDSGFKLSEERLLQAVDKAAAVWEKAAGEDLFVYKKDLPAFPAGGSMPINLVYDSRQAITQQNNVLKDAIDQTSGTVGSVKAAYDAAQAAYSQSKQEFLATQAHYEQSLDSYNATVKYWNARGGAPQKEYAALQSQKESLRVEAQSLESKRISLNAQTATLNSLGERYNSLVKEVNANVGTINRTAGREFEEGLYTKNGLGAKIDIYEYSDEDKLVRVLAHELGHSLGLGHNTNPKSIMYSINESGNMVPTAEDMASLKEVCGI